MKCWKSVEKKGDYEVLFTLKYKDPNFYNNTLDSYGILPEHILKDVPVAELEDNDFNRKIQLARALSNLKNGKTGNTSSSWLMMTTMTAVRI